MVAYFKRQTWLIMLGGFALAMAIAAGCWNTVLVKETLVNRLAFVMLLGLLGVVIARIQAAKWANKRLEKLSARLYRDCDPEGFIREFEPVAAAVPRDNVVFADAQTKLSYAWEALGDFDRALAALEPVKPEGMKMHSLHASAILLNQRTRALLMKEDLPGAAESLKRMEALEVDAAQRAKMLGEQLHACNRLARSWYDFLSGGEADLDYLEQEAELAKNDIYRAEMELLCGRVLAARGEVDAARGFFEQASGHGRGLYAGRQARERLAEIAPQPGAEA